MFSVLGQLWFLAQGISHPGSPEWRRGSHAQACSITVLHSLLYKEVQGVSMSVRVLSWGFSVGSVVKKPPANAGNMSSIPDPGKSPISRSPCTTTIGPKL